MKILVTGGAGFIGSHLCAKLRHQGHDVWCMDNLSTGSPERVGPKFINGDVAVGIPGTDWHQIYNLACPASPVAYQRDPIATMRTCVVGAMMAAHTARRTGATVLQASTSEVYGDPLQSPQAETYLGNVSTIGPRACYDEGKRAAEAVFFDYHRKFGTRIKVARIFNTYGPHMAVDDGRAVSNFIGQALLGEPITIYGDGSQTRSFCYVDDTVDALIALMNSNDITTGPINVGNPYEITIRDLAERVLRATGSCSEIVHLPATQDDPRRRCPDVAKAKELLGWEPKVRLSRGLPKTVAYFREVLG